ncbi:MAG: hypothetical protein V4574_21330 [Pseudomonadota bacterium]
MIVKTGAVSIGLALALGLAGCADPQAASQVKSEAKAEADKAEASDKAEGKARHNVECLNALHWQEGALAKAGIGDVKIYTDYFQERLDAALGTAIIATKPPEPMLSRATMHDYMNWSYPEAVKRFTGGSDGNKDGTISSVERTYPGYAKVLACVQEVAEMGKGPLAGKDKVARMFRIQELRGQLKDKGA